MNFNEQQMNAILLRDARITVSASAGAEKQRSWLSA